LYSGIAAKVKPVQGVAERPPEVIPVRKSRPGLRWKWAAVPAIAIIIIVAAYWGWIAKEDHTPPADYLADRVAGIYHGDVVSDARGSSRSDVTLTITKLGPRKVRVESDYKRLGTIEIDLTRVGKTIQSAGGRPLLLLDMEQNPPRLSFNPDGEVAYEGVRGRQPTAASPVQASKPPEAVDAAYAIEDLWCAPANSKRPTNPKNPITARAAEMLSPEFTVDSNRHILLDKNNQPVSVVPAASLGPLDHLRFILVHFSAGTAKGLESYFQQPDVQASVHVMIARDGTVKQLVPFDFAARHAGVGEWKGLTGLNRYSVGIDLENWGQLQRKNGVWVSWAGREVPEAEVIPAADSAAGWHKYTDAQIRGFFFVSCALIKAYPAIEDIVGHEQISPGRKNDPGPAFPIQEMKRRLMIGGRRESGTENK
ncbi:MAG TPA: N-acetylmuramoyl-L-alanine amidase, partial [Desulfobacterales bacterium]|nr:N-acetylmuramoyl-L-alanine amidase [Desulfobacterales bacterium]